MTIFLTGKPDSLDIQKAALDLFNRVYKPDERRIVGELPVLSTYGEMAQAARDFVAAPWNEWIEAFWSYDGVDVKLEVAKRDEEMPRLIVVWATVQESGPRSIIWSAKASFRVATIQAPTMVMSSSTSCKVRPGHFKRVYKLLEKMAFDARMRF